MKRIKKTNAIMQIMLIAILLSSCKKVEPQVDNDNNVVKIAKAFSVSVDKQVFFSKGNLQYQASTNTWRFALNQWEVVGYDNANVSEAYEGWIDLFGWGTSGHNHGAICYQPWSTSDISTEYYAYGENSYNLYDKTGEADWGHNLISNAENQAVQWRTLTKEEWEYLFYFRTTDSDIRYAKAIVNGRQGMVLVPDDWNETFFNLNNVNLYNASYSSNEILLDDWLNVFESNGAIFLPVTGFRSGTDLQKLFSFGCYWSASSKKGYPYFLLFDSNMFYANYSNSRGGCLGMSVRLVCAAE